MFGGFAVLTLLALGTLPFLPHAYSAEEIVDPEARKLPNSLLIIALAGVLAYDIWRDRMGGTVLVGATLTEQIESPTPLPLAILCRGALASVFLAACQPQRGDCLRHPHAGTASIVLLIGKPSLTLFVVRRLRVERAVELRAAVHPWTRVYHDFDESGRMMSFAIMMQMIGLGGGPLIRQLLDGSRYRSAELLCVALLLSAMHCC